MMSRLVVAFVVVSAVVAGIVIVLGIDQAIIAGIAALVAGGSHVHRTRKEGRRRLQIVTGERDRHVEAVRRTVGRADEIKRHRVKVEVEAADVHEAADDALRRAEALEREADE
jgi:hypothetical protein